MHLYAYNLIPGAVIEARDAAQRLGNLPPTTHPFIVKEVGRDASSEAIYIKDSAGEVLIYHYSQIVTLIGLDANIGEDNEQTDFGKADDEQPLDADLSPLYRSKS